LSVCVRLIGVYVVLSVGKRPATGWSPVQGVLSTPYRTKKLKKKSGQGPTKSCTAIIILIIIIWTEIWWNDDWQGKPKYSEKTRPSPTLSTTNPTWPDPGSNPGRRGAKPATNRLSYDAAYFHCVYWPTKLTRRIIFWSVFGRWRSSNLGRDNDYLTDVFRGFPKSFRENVTIIFWNKTTFVSSHILSNPSFINHPYIPC
jgi:hypothetical protein